MRNYIILNGVNSNTISGLLISTLPPITKPKIRTQTEEIDGRDGDIVTKLGYSAYDKEFEIGLYGDFDINEVIAYFNSEGTVVFSNEADKYYNYQILDQIDYEKLIRFKTAKIKMHVQPFKYPLEEEQIQVDATVVEAEGSNISLQYTNPSHTITSELKGDLYQKTTTGKNLFNINSTPFISRVAYNSRGVQQNWDNYSGTTTKTPIQSSTTYTITENKNTYTKYIVEYDSSETFIQRTVLSNYNKTFTTSANTKYINISVSSEIVPTKVQIEEGTTPTEYEEYTGGQPSPSPDYPQEIEVVTGQQEILVETKNLFDKDNANILNANVNNDNVASSNNARTLYIPIVGGETYTISKVQSARFRVATTVQIPNLGVSTSQFNGDIDSNTTYTITTNSTANYLCVYFYLNGTDTLTEQEILDSIQIEKGSQATDFVEYHSQSYTIDLGTTELYGIPDTAYRDRVYQNENTWYIERQVGKVVLNGSENWEKSNSASSSDYLVCYFTTTLSKGNNYQDSLCNYFTYGVVGSISSENCFQPYSSSNNIGLNIKISTSIANTAGGFKTWLSTHNTTVYYVLETPITTEITDTDLLAQLNELAEATTYENTTNISVTGSLPLILKATTSGMPNTVINNIGNIYAKPLITIYGSGTIGVYLNQIQVLQIDLGNNGSITIDVSKMEAYNNSTKALMNRLVTGDYMKFLINSGENNIAFSGNVAGFTMDNYTRWL